VLLGGGLFEQPEVKLLTDEGQNFLQRPKEKYDVIISIQTMTAAAVTSGAIAHSESYMFTREAFADYLDHLTPDGAILVTRAGDQIVKLFHTAGEVFEKRSLGNPATHLLGNDTSWHRAPGTLVWKVSSDLLFAAHRARARS
jgi:spermidine synthase